MNGDQATKITILSENNTVAANYTYDAWGKLLSITDANGNTITSGIGVINPIRYRGYYYDTETGLYYVSSRYYDPEVGRFISPDTTDVLTATPMALTDKNLYAYCDNNPIMRVDNGGDFWNWVIGAAVGAVAGVLGQVVSDVVTSVVSGELTLSNWQTYTGAFIGGAVGGAILGGTGNVALANAACYCCNFWSCLCGRNNGDYAALPFRISAERIDERKVDESQTQDAATETVNSDEQSGNDTAETGKKQEKNKNVLVSVILGAFGIIALAAAAIGLHNRKKIRLRRNKS